VTAGVGACSNGAALSRRSGRATVRLDPAGVKHWQALPPTTAMTHIAIQEHVDGKVVD